jgi:uroporphyrinogen-III synthase
VIGVINVHHRESHDHSPDEISLLVFIGEQMGGILSRSLLEEEKAQALEEVATFKRQLEDRKLVERAKGIIQQKYSTTEEDAYFRLRNQSRRLRRPMRELAEAIILAEDMGREVEAE